MIKSELDALKQRLQAMHDGLQEVGTGLNNTSNHQVLRLLLASAASGLHLAILEVDREITPPKKGRKG